MKQPRRVNKKAPSVNGRGLPVNRLHSLITAKAATNKPFLPIADKNFAKCSNAISCLSSLHGKPVLLPSAMLPPLF